MKLLSRHSSPCVVSKAYLSSMVKPLIVGLVVAGVASPALALDYFWNSGQYSANEIPRTIGPLDRLFAQSNLSKVLDVSVVNGGTFVQDDGTVLFYSTLTNNGTYDVQGDLSLFGLRSNGSLTNNGLLEKSAGTGAATIELASLINNGTIDAQTGTIEYNNGVSTFNAGTVLAGGLHRLNRGAAFSADPAFSSNLEFAAGTFTAIPATGVSLNSNLSWTGGTIAGKWTNAAGQTLTASSNNLKVLNSAFVNVGTFVQKDRAIDFYNTLTNNGTYDVQGDLSLADHVGGKLTNNGVLKKSAGTGVASVRVTFANTAEDVRSFV